MKILLTFLSLLFISTTTAQSFATSDAPVNPEGLLKYHKDHFMLKGPVKKVILYSKIKRSKSLKQIESDYLNSTITIVRGYEYPKGKTYTFDRDGYLLTETNGDNDYVKTYNYNEKNQLVSIDTKYEDEDNPKKRNYISDSNGNINRVVTNYAYDDYEYNGKNQLIKYLDSYNESKGGSKGVTTYTYNNSSQVITESIEKVSGRMIINTFITYSYKKLEPQKWLVTENTKRTLKDPQLGNKTKEYKSQMVYTNGVLTVADYGVDENRYKFTTDRFDNVITYENATDDSKINSYIKKEINYW
tara:strand:- start:322 stop:1224 length:903 start_codon:yes stop_codon:yes gene_type:complete